MVKTAVHFGAGNIGRGFIGETLASNGFEIKFVDVNETVIDALNARHEYDIELAAEGHKKIHVSNVEGINNKLHPERVVAAIESADIVTTAIGPKVLPFIAPLIADGIKARKAANNTHFIDVIACENMIGGSAFLKTETYKTLNSDEQLFADQYIGFPNAAVDRIVPIQHHDDPLFVSVEPFKEWVIDESQSKNHDIHLTTVHYVKDLEPYIERKLFSVNTGHATVAYTGKYKGYTTIGEAIKDETVVAQLSRVLKETGSLLIAKWDFDPTELKDYQDQLVSRFKNPYISDDISRVARTPIRKLGYNERFVRPMRELKDRGLDYQALLETAAMMFVYNEPADDESVKLLAMEKEQGLRKTIETVTELKDTQLVDQIQKQVEELH